MALRLPLPQLLARLTVFLLLGCRDWIRGALSRRGIAVPRRTAPSALRFEWTVRSSIKTSRTALASVWMTVKVGRDVEAVGKCLRLEGSVGVEGG